MPNIKSAKKRVEIGASRNARNKSNRSEIKTVLKKFNAAVESGDRQQAENAYKVAVKRVDKAAGSGLIHKNNAAHKKSAITQKLNSMAN